MTEKNKLIPLSTLDSYIQQLYWESYDSNSGMVFVAIDDSDFLNLSEEQLKKIKSEVKDNGLEDIVIFGENDCEIVVYSDIQEVIKDDTRYREMIR